jgi:hypothetical protein
VIAGPAARATAAGEARLAIDDGLPLLDSPIDQKDSLELVVRGCLKGKDLTAVEISGGEGLPGYVNAVFRLSAKGDLDKAIKQQNGRFLDVTGTVSKSSFAEPGMKVGNTRIMIGQPMSTDPTANPARNPQKKILPMQVSAIAVAGDSCPSFVEKK